MKLLEVWNYFTPDVKRVFTGLAGEHDRVRTKSLLGALLDVSEENTAAVLSRIESDGDTELIHLRKIPDESGACPEGLTFSPCVKESLNFFRIHQLRPVTSADLALRVLQIGTGSTVMALERAGILTELQEDLQQLATL